MAPFKLPSSILPDTDEANFFSGSIEGRHAGDLVLAVKIGLTSVGGGSGNEAVRALIRLVRFCRLPSRGGIVRILLPDSRRFFQASRSPGDVVIRRRIVEKCVQHAGLAERGMCLSNGPEGRENVKGGMVWVERLAKDEIGAA